jgi:hypothetical protein
MPNRIYSFILTCSDNANQLTSDSCTVKIDVVESPGDDTTSFNMFNVSDSGVLTLKDNVDRNSIKRVVIPNILNGLSVTTIGDNAFENCTSLASVDLGSVATIGNEAF